MCPSVAKMDLYCDFEIGQFRNHIHMKMQLISPALCITVCLADLPRACSPVHTPVWLYELTLSIYLYLSGLIWNQFWLQIYRITTKRCIHTVSLNELFDVAIWIFIFWIFYPYLTWWDTDYNSNDSRKRTTIIYSNTMGVLHYGVKRTFPSVINDSANLS